MTKQERRVLHGEMGSTGIVCDVRGLIEGAAGIRTRMRRAGRPVTLTKSDTPLYCDTHRVQFLD